MKSRCWKPILIIAVILAGPIATMNDAFAATMLGYNTVSGWYPYQGLLSNVAIYTSALSATQIVNQYAAG